MVRAPRGRKPQACAPSKAAKPHDNPPLGTRTGSGRGFVISRVRHVAARILTGLAYCRGVSQLSFFSAESVPGAVTDLTGLLATTGQIVVVGDGARISVVVDRPWRAAGLAEMVLAAGLQPEISRTEEDTPLLRTSVDPRLRAIAAQWTRGAVKTVPATWLPGPRELRAWVLAAGSPDADRYLLGLDPHAPDTHAPLASALMRVGIAPTLTGTRGARPALRIGGRRRLSRLVENVGEHPDGDEALSQWPHV